MTRPAYKYLEMWDDNAPQSASGFAQDGGSAEMSFLVQKLDGSPLDDIDLCSIPTDVLGKVTTTPIPSGTRKGCRTISTPLVHPYHPWLYAYAVTDLRGRGQFSQQSAILSDVFDCNGTPLPGFPNFCYYKNYLIKVQFRPLPWNVIDDTCVTAVSSSYFLDDDDGTGGATSFTFAPGEWMRYVDVAVQQREDSLTAQQGQMQFNMFQAGTVPLQPLYNLKAMPTYVGMPKMFIPNALYKVLWKYVPYRYITSSNSYITGGGSTRSDGTSTYGPRDTWRGRINQNTMTINGTIFPPGALMYVSYDYKLSTPPVQETIDINYVGSGGGSPLPNQSYTVYDKLVDVTFVFLTTTRSLQDGETTFNVTNRSFVQNGFNLEPWYMDRQYHYAQSSPNSLLEVFLPRQPSFLSAPLELLTYDPDVSNGGI